MTRWNLKLRPGTQAIYDLNNADYRGFLRTLDKAIPHSDHIPSGIWHEPPTPSVQFDVNWQAIDYENLNEKFAKIFKRLRHKSQWLIKSTYSSTIHFFDLKEWDIASGASSFADLAPSSDDFENYYFLAEDFSFGVICVVNGGRIIFFGESLLAMINGNRQLQPLFWRSRDKI